MPLEEFLFPHEEIQLSFNERNLVKYAKTDYQVFFTNQRLVLYAKTGLILKRENVVSLAFEDVIKIDYKEKGLFKKGYCLVATPLMKYSFEGDTEVIKELVKYLQKFVPTRIADRVKEKEKEIITRETVLIPCDYCGQLMPQTSVFCPNCGARRK